MGVLQVLDDRPSHLKALFQGPQGSGKTYTATLLACAAHKQFGSKKPIAYFDTEKASDFVAGLIQKLTGKPPIRVKTRAFKTLMEAAHECDEGAADILLVDSITHVWREVQAAYLAKVNAGRDRPKKRMDLQDIMAVKDTWQAWPDWYLNSLVHVIVCGREGNEWEHQEDEETGKRELVTVGKKAKVETEFGYEPHLIVGMSTRQEGGGLVKARGKAAQRVPRKIIPVATVLKDRTALLHGKVCEWPTAEFFEPLLKVLRPAEGGAVNTSVSTDPDVAESGKPRWKVEKEIALEKIEAALVRIVPGTTGKDKATKGGILERVFGTRSWTEISERMSVERLVRGTDWLEAACAKVAIDIRDGVDLNESLAQRLGESPDQPHEQARPRLVRDDAPKGAPQEAVA